MVLKHVVVALLIGAGFWLPSVLGGVAMAGASTGGDIVKTPAQGEAALAETAGMIKGYGIELINPVQVRLLPMDELQREWSAHRGKGTVGNGFSTFRPPTVWILGDRPKAHVMGTMAHELTHHWAYENRLRRPRIIDEGLPQWVSHKVFLAFGEFDKCRLQLRHQPDLRDGLLYFLMLEGKGGITAVLDYARGDAVPSPAEIEAATAYHKAHARPELR